MSLITFQDQQNIVTDKTKVSDAATLATIKRDINTGGSKFMAALDRPYNRIAQFADLVDGQTAYQFPQNCQRPRLVLALNDPDWDPLIEVTSEREWDLVTQGSLEGPPKYVFFDGADGFSVWPASSSNLESGLQMVYEPKSLILTQNDFTTGTVTVTNGDATITHSATGFTVGMVGRGFAVTDGSDGNWYRIASFTSSSSMELENAFLGTSASGVAFRIGEVMNIPEEHLEAPSWYSLFNFQLGRDQKLADGYDNLFRDSLKEARTVYGRKASSAIVRATNVRNRGYDGLRDSPIYNAP